jgi:hypothetical protein
MYPFTFSILLDPLDERENLILAGLLRKSVDRFERDGLLRTILHALGLLFLDGFAEIADDRLLPRGVEGDGAERADPDAEGAAIALLLVDVDHASLLVLGHAFLRARCNAGWFSAELATHCAVDHGLDADALDAGIDRNELVFVRETTSCLTYFAACTFCGIDYYKVLIGSWHLNII